MGGEQESTRMQQCRYFLPGGGKELLAVLVTLQGQGLPLPAAPSSIGVVSDAGAVAVENVTTRPARALDAARQGTMSLYALDLWPRGQVQVEVAA